MAFFRLLLGLLFVGCVLCFGMYIGTRDRLWLRRGWLILKWALVAGCAFFAVLILERVAVAL